MPVVITQMDGSEDLWKRKIQKELMAMMIREHLEVTKKELGIDEAETQAYRFFDESGNEWVERI